MFKDLSEDKAYHMNIISVIILLTIVLIFGVFVYYYSTKPTKTQATSTGSLDKFTNVLAFLYLGFAIAGSILYAVYTHDSEDTNGLFKSAVKGIIMIIVSVLITMLIIHVKGSVAEYVMAPIKANSKYLLADSTTTVVGETTSPMKLTNTY
jgi:hypothetical protein